MDRLVASATTIAASPLLLTRACVAYVRTGRVFDRHRVVGADGRVFTLITFAGDQVGSRMPHLLAVARGDLRFVGPRPLTEAEARGLTVQERWRLDVVPGMFSPHRLRAQTGIAYDEELDADRHLYDPGALSARHKVGIIARSLLASALAGESEFPAPDTITLLGVSITNTTMDEALDWIFARVAAAGDAARIGQGDLVCFANPGCLNISYIHDDYRRVLERSALVLPDGIGIKLASRVQRFGVRENVNGTDMFPRLCQRAAATGTPIFLLGAGEGVAAAAAETMRQRFPDLIVAGTHHGYLPAEQEQAIVDQINASGAEILLVAMGVPRQELWLERMRPSLRPAVMMGVGGLFDFYSGRIPRAPLWVREIGMEWAWRLAQEPGRMWRRYIVGNPLFLFRVWRQRPRPTTPG